MPVLRGAEGNCCDWFIVALALERKREDAGQRRGEDSDGSG